MLQAHTTRTLTPNVRVFFRGRGRRCWPQRHRVSLRCQGISDVRLFRRHKKTLPNIDNEHYKINEKKSPRHVRQGPVSLPSEPVLCFREQVF